MSELETQADDWTTPIPPQKDDGHELCIRMTRMLESKTQLFGGYYETFAKTLDLIYYALLADEQEYMKLVKELKPEAVKVAAEICGELINAFCVEYRFDNYLGRVYEALSHNDKRLGQFFTPWNVAYMMARMNLGDVKAQIEKAKQEKRKISVCDPSVGSGVMLLAAKRVVIEQAGLEGLDYFEFYGNDIDHLCVKMCKIHMMLTDYRYMTSRLLLVLGEVQERTRPVVPVEPKLEKTPEPAFTITSPPTGTLDDWVVSA